MRRTASAARLSVTPQLAATASSASSGRSATALFLFHQRRTYAAKVKVQQSGEFKKDVFGHQAVKLDGGKVLVFPSRGRSPFAGASVYQIDTTGDEWKWETKSVKGPLPHMDARAHTFGSQLIVTGTFVNLGLFKKRGLVSFNTQDFSTVKLSMMDMASHKATKNLNLTHFVSAATHNPDQLWFFGENYLNMKDENASCEVAYWDKAKNSLFAASTGTLPLVGEGPKEKKELAAVSVGKHRIYLLGPDIYNTKLETYVLDTERLEWSLVKTKGDKPVNPRSGFAATAVGDKILFLGYDMSLGGKEMESYVLDTDTSTWEKAELTGDTISPRFGHTMTHLGNNEFAAIGGKGHGYFSTSVKDFFKLQAQL